LVKMSQKNAAEMERARKKIEELEMDNLRLSNSSQKTATNLKNMLKTKNREVSELYNAKTHAESLVSKCWEAQHLLLEKYHSVESELKETEQFKQGPAFVTNVQGLETELKPGDVKSEGLARQVEVLKNQIATLEKESFKAIEDLTNRHKTEMTSRANMIISLELSKKRAVNSLHKAWDVIFKLPVMGVLEHGQLVGRIHNIFDPQKNWTLSDSVWMSRLEDVIGEMSQQFKDGRFE
jgi:chromosome segregation ATPase